MIVSLHLLCVVCNYICGENYFFSLGLKTVHILYILGIEFPALSVMLNLSFL